MNTRQDPIEASLTPSPGEAAPELNRSPGAIEYTDYFDASAIDFVAETFAVDIAVGGYSVPS